MPSATVCRHRASMLVLIALLLPAAAGAQQNIGSLFLFSAATGQVGVGRFTRDAQFEPGWMGVGLNVPTGWVKVVRTSHGIVLYNPQTGSARVMRVGHGNVPLYPTTHSWAPGWETITASGPFVVFRMANGAGAIGHITPDGQYVETAGYPPGSWWRWTDIVANDNNIVFYDWDTGWSAIGYIDPSGTYVETAGAYLMPRCRTLFGHGRYILCYRYETRTLQVTEIDNAGQPRTTDVVGVGPGYGVPAIAAQGEHLIFLDGYGSTTIGRIDRDGRFVQTQQTTILTRPGEPVFVAPDAVAATRDAVLFLRRQMGWAVAGFVDREGIFQQTGAPPLPLGWTDVVATRRD